MLRQDQPVQFFRKPETKTSLNKKKAQAAKPAEREINTIEENEISEYTGHIERIF
ncbi:MAG: hypothetical protein ACK521_04550 [bacterium]